MEKHKAKHKEKLTRMLAVHAKVQERRAVMAATKVQCIGTAHAIVSKIHASGAPASVWFSA